MLGNQSEGTVRATWQFYTVTLRSEETFRDASQNRAFKYDAPYFEYYNLVPTKVVCHTDVLMTAHCHTVPIVHAEQTSGAENPALGFNYQAANNARPSVFVMNHANAHSTKYMVPCVVS